MVTKVPFQQGKMYYSTNTLMDMMRDALAELSLPAAQSAIRRRMVYRKSVIQGRSVLDVGSQGAAAADEIRQLVDEMVNLL